MRNHEERHCLTKANEELREAAKEIQEFMDTVKDLEVWDEAARHLAELLGWIDHNEKQLGTTSR